MRTIDDLDEKVLSCLARDARATYAQIGKEVGLSAPAVKRRVDRLVADGVIRGFTAIVDPHAMQWTTEAYVLVYCRGNISPEELRAAWEPIPEVVGAATITGGADAILRVRARDVRHLEQALERILNWVLAGYQAYPSRGLDEPEAVLAAGRRARADSSSFATFAAGMFTVTGAAEDRIRTRDLWSVWSMYRREATELSNARPNSERDLWPLLIKELGKRVSHQKSTGGKSPACLLGVKWSEEGQELFERAAGGAMLPGDFVQGHVMPRTGRLTPVVPPGPAA